MLDFLFLSLYSGRPVIYCTTAFGVVERSMIQFLSSKKYEINEMLTFLGAKSAKSIAKSTARQPRLPESRPARATLHAGKVA